MSSPCALTLHRQLPKLSKRSIERREEVAFYVRGGMRQVCSGAANRWHPSSRLTSLRPRTVNVASQFANREQDGCGVSWTCHPRPTKRIECCIEQHSRSGTSRTRTADHMAVLLTSVHGNSVPSAELVVGNRVCGWNNDLPTKMRGFGSTGGFRLASASGIHRVAQGGSDGRE